MFFLGNGRNTPGVILPLHPREARQWTDTSVEGGIKREKFPWTQQWGPKLNLGFTHTVFPLDFTHSVPTGADNQNSLTFNFKKFFQVHGTP